MANNLIKKSKSKKTETVAKMAIPMRDTVWVTLDDERYPNGVFATRTAARDSGLGVVHRFDRV